MEQNEILSEGYDYIVATVKVQGRLLPKDVLYGDGSRFGFNRVLFEMLYDEIAKLIS